MFMEKYPNMPPTDDRFVFISPSALRTALNHIRYEKEVSLDSNDSKAVSSWRDCEKQFMAAQYGLGLAKTRDIL